MLYIQRNVRVYYCRIASSTLKGTEIATSDTRKSDWTFAGDCTGHVQRPEHDRAGADDARRVAKALLRHAVFEVETRFIDAQIVVER